MEKINFNPKEEDGLELARAIVIARLKTDANWIQIESMQEGFNNYVNYIDDTALGKKALGLFINEILWEFIIQRVISPGLEMGEKNLPYFHITEYGKKVLEAEEFLPHDPTGYLERFQKETPSPDMTVVSYLAESLNCFTTGNLIASVVMLGVASEKTFLLLCESFCNSIDDVAEKSEFKTIYESISMKRKMDWVVNKIQEVQKKNKKSKPLPDDIDTTLIGIFNFIRRQRNELGHPQEKPPKVTREEVFVNLRLFPSYYKSVNHVISYLNKNKV